MGRKSRIRGTDAETKYKEAVARNLKGAKSKKKYKGVKLTLAKMWIGVRADDSSHDEEIEKIIK